MADPTRRSDPDHPVPDPPVPDPPLPEHPVPERSGRRRLRWPWDPLTTVVLIAVAGYAVIGIGSPLFGWKVFAATDLLTRVSPYRDSGLADTPVQNNILNDTIDAYLPNIMLFVSALYDGQFAPWNPYIIGGTPLGATPNLGLLNPAALPYLLLPAWLAPGYVKLAEIALAGGGTFLFLRRIRLGRAAALLGGLVFASSGFMVVWTNWPHTRVAALIPWLLWALDRLVVRRRPTDGVLVSLVTAGLLFGGFPAVAGYGLLTGAVYLAVRVFGEYRTEWRRIAGVAVGAAGAVVGGMLLAAVQLAPFVSFMSAAQVTGREQTPADHLQPASLVTGIAPWAVGSTNPSRPPAWFLDLNLVEAHAYLGAAAAVLVVAALAMPTAGRRLAPRGVWWFLVGSAGAWFVVLYLGRFPLWLLQQLPLLFADNFVGRARSVWGLLLAALAAVGFQVLVDARRSAPVRSSSEAAAVGPGRRRYWYPAAVWVVAALAVVAAWWYVRRVTYAVSAADGVPPGERVPHLDRQMLYAVGWLLAAAALVALLWWAGRRAGESRRVRLVAASLLPLLIAGQALTFAVPYWPRVDRDTFFPVTGTHRWLSDHLGHDRFAGSGGGMYVGADSEHRLRALTGHFFLNRRFAETVDGLPGRQFGNPPTYLNLPVDPTVVGSPVLDRLAVRYFVASPGETPLGRVTGPSAAGVGETELAPGSPVSVPVPGSGPLRAVGLTPAAPFDTGRDTRIELRLTDASGVEVAAAERLLYDTSVGETFWIPVPAERVPAGERLTARLVLHAPHPMRVRGAGDPALGTVRPADDGLRIAYAGDSVIYERLRALPRIRWASDAVVEPDPERRVALVASGGLAPDQVVLDAPVSAGPAGRPGPGAGSGPGSPAGGGTAEPDTAPATLRVDHDGLSVIEASVTAGAAGYLVVADALQQDWVATVDGRPADLVPADHGLVAVPVGEGRHTVRLAYRMPYHNAGGVLTGLTALVLSSLVVVEWWRRTRSAAPPRPVRG